MKDHCSSDFFDLLLKADPVACTHCHKRYTSAIVVLFMLFMSL